MARTSNKPVSFNTYDSEGYRKDGRRKILGYSSRVQGGRDEKFAAAEAARNAHYRPSAPMLAPKGDEMAQFRNPNGTPKADRGVTVAGPNGSTKTIMPKPLNSLPDLLRRPQDQVARDRVESISPAKSYLGPLNRMIDEAKGKTRRRADGSVESLLLKRPAMKSPGMTGKRYV